MGDFKWFVFGMLMLAFLAGGGCNDSKTQVIKLPTRYPIISMSEAYPDGQTAEEYFAEEQQFMEDFREGLQANMVTEGEQEVMRHYFRERTLRKAAEAKIRSYNEYARGCNTANGYK